MLSRPPRPFALVRTEDQWRRAAHQGTALVGEVVQLAWTSPDAEEGAAVAPLPGAGLAFDAHCRLFHSRPEEGRVERLLWAAPTPVASTDVFAPAAESELGDFHGADPAAGGLANPRGLVVDAHERLRAHGHADLSG